MTAIDLVTGILFVIILTAVFLGGFVVGAIFMFSHIRRQLAEAGILMERVKPSDEGEEWKKRTQSKIDKDNEDWLRRNLGDY